jgi:hypothetical protein
MNPPARSLVLSLASAILTACGGAPELPPGLALALDFEESCEPRATAELALEAPGAGLSFDSGLEGSAARFDGSGAALKLRGIDRLGLAQALTLELFVNADAWVNPYEAGRALESLVSHSTIFTLALDPHAWTLRGQLTLAQSEEPVRLGGGGMQPGRWHHVALVFDGARARLVLDGEVVADEPSAGTLAPNAELDLVLGTWFQRNQAFCGRMDSVRLWNRALAPEELQARARLVPAEVDG